MPVVPERPIMPAPAPGQPGPWARTPLFTGVGLALVFFACFAWLAQDVIYRQAWEEHDRHWALAMKEYSEGRPTLRSVLVTATLLGGIRAMVVLAVVGAVWQVKQKRRGLGLAVVLLALGGGLVDLGLKEVFDRDRPPADWRDAFVKETNESFPSGHAMGSTIGYGLLCYLVMLQNIRRRWKILALANLTLLVLVIGLSRIYLRAHWSSDVAGGFLIGAGWLALGLGILESLRRKGRNRPQQTIS